MPYREKIGWLSLVAMAVAFGPYFTIVAVGSRWLETLPHLYRFGLLAAAAVLQMLILGLGHLVLHLRSPQEARTPLDERDRAIMRRSINAAYYVLIAGMIVVGCVMPFHAGGWTLVNAAFFMIIVAELVHYGIVVLSYRRQS